MKSFIFILLITIIISACGQGKIKPVINPDLEGKKIAVQESWNSKILFTEFGITKAILYADHISVFEDEHETVLENMKIDFYDDAGIEITSVLTSKRGRVDDLTNDMYAIDSVVAVSDSGVTLTTDELKWNNRTEEITTDKFVRIVTPDEIIEGYGLVSDQSITNYRIYDPTYQAYVKDEK